MKDKKFGQLERQYNFSLNPYPDLRFSKCSRCETKTGQRKLPLVVHVHPHNLILLSYTNRYCKECNLLIGHQHEIEHHLIRLFSETNPDIVGNEYLIVGSVNKNTWQKSRKKALLIKEIIENTHDFISYEKLQMTMSGWFKENEKPPLMKPPKSAEWIKANGSQHTL